MALKSLPPEVVAKGPCKKPIKTSDTTWLVIGGKTDGANPGFTIQDTSDGRRYLLKFEDQLQPQRATSADVIGSKIYWAFGFWVPCNQIVNIDDSIFKMKPGTKVKNEIGEKRLMTRADIDRVLKNTPRLKNGKIRGVASLFLEGRPIGPFTYEGTRSDDPNDVIPHENRRELRGSKLLAAWLNHSDAREQNSLNTFIETEAPYGYVRHNVLDFGDCFGSEWEWDLMSRRLGYSYYFDPTHVAQDFLSLGLITRPWDTVQINKEKGPSFGYYDIKHFDVLKWQNAYPNTSFDRMTAQDAFWASKTISRFSDEHIKALVDEAQLASKVQADYLQYLIKGRRDKIVMHYLMQFSAFDLPQVKENGSLCLTDLLTSQGYLNETSQYRFSLNGQPIQPQLTEGEHCFNSFQEPYNILSASIKRKEQKKFTRPMKIHVVLSPNLKVIGIER